MEGFKFEFDAGKVALGYDWEGKVEVTAKVALITLLEEYAKSTDNTIDDKIAEWAKAYLGAKVQG